MASGFGTGGRITRPILRLLLRCYRRPRLVVLGYHLRAFVQLAVHHGYQFLGHGPAHALDLTLVLLWLGAAHQSHRAVLPLRATPARLSSAQIHAHAHHQKIALLGVAVVLLRWPVTRHLRPPGRPPSSATPPVARG